jgi:D-alanine-D-alanine ligase-like ATP-grasp enzyme
MHPNKKVPEFLHNELEGLTEITISDRERYKTALEKTPQNTWVNYFPFLLSLNATPSRSILLGEENGSLCVYLLIQWPRKNRLHLYLPPMPMRQDSLRRCFVRINAYNGDTLGRLWWISAALQAEVEQSGIFRLKPIEEEFIYDPSVFENLAGKKFSALRYNIRRAERQGSIEIRPFTLADRSACLELLDKWQQTKANRSDIATSYLYSKACLQLFEQFSPEEISGSVYVIEGKIRAFAFGGRLSGKTACSFLNISDHDVAGLGYFARFHFFKNTQGFTSINDGGASGIPGLAVVKNSLAPMRLEVVYKGYQKKLPASVVSAAVQPRIEVDSLEQNRCSALKGLKILMAEDHQVFQNCSNLVSQKSSIYYFPFLSNLSNSKQHTLFWELYRDSICLYCLSEISSGKRLSLYVPPFPFRGGTLAYAMDKVHLFNGDTEGEIDWIEELESEEVRKLGYEIWHRENEFLFSKETSQHFPLKFNNSSVEEAAGKEVLITHNIVHKKVYQLFRAKQASTKNEGTKMNEVKDKNTAIFIKASRELGYEIKVVSSSYSYCVISNGRKSLHVYHNATSISDVATRKVTNNKYLSQKILRVNGLPVPNSRVFELEDIADISNYVQRHKPVVVKPLKGSNSKGVTIDPRNEEEVRLAVARIKDDKVMVEKLIFGNDYRVLLFHGKIIDVLQWVGPYIVGNGLSSIHELVEEKNQYYLVNDLHSIEIDFEFLKSQGADIGMVPKRGEKLFLNKLREHFVGGEAVRISIETIHPINQQLFVRTAEVSGLPLVGLDFISQDLGVPYTKNSAGINEINSTPHVWPHFFAEQKEDLTGVKTILEGFFAD